VQYAIEYSGQTTMPPRSRQPVLQVNGDSVDFSAAHRTTYDQTPFRRSSSLTRKPVSSLDRL